MFNLRKIFQIELIRVSGLSSVSTLIKIASTLVISKVLAIIAGPEGVTLMGQLNNGALIIYGIASLAINVGVTKYIAEFEDEPLKQQTIVSNTIKITLIVSLIVSVIIFLFAGQIGHLLFKTYNYITIIKCLSVFITFYTLNNLLLSILNGFKKYKLFIVVNIITSLTTLVITLGLIYFLKVYGALLAFCISQSVVILITYFLIHKQIWFKNFKWNILIDWNIIKKLASFSLMSFTSMLLGNMVQLANRSILIKNYNSSLVQAGIWEGMNKISSAYTLIIVTSITISYLPKMSAIKNYASLHKEILLAYKIVIPFTLISSIIIFFCRNIIIQLLYAKSFGTMNELFIYQLIGDNLRIAGWLIGYLMLAKAFIKTFIAFEFFFSFLLLGLNYILITHYGIKGAVIAYASCYFFYLIACGIFYKTQIWNKI